MPMTNGKKLPVYKWEYCTETCEFSNPRNLIESILSKRGLNGSDEIYHSPFLMGGMKAAVERIKAAVAKKERILLHGDYDVDGIVGTVIFHRFLKSIGGNSRIFLPRRHIHGYGFSQESVDKAVKAKISLIITVDCGLSAHDTARNAKEHGIDVVITDHHNVPDVLPDAIAIVHSQVPSGSYPFHSLSGAGVAYKLILALADELRIDLDEKQYLPYVALSVISDIMPIVGENRRFVRDGLQAIRDGHAPHIERIAELAGYNNRETLTERELAIHVGSRLNAPGRLRSVLNSTLASDEISADISAKYLLEEDSSRMGKLAERIDRLNSKRREEQERLARKILESAYKERHLPIHILHDPEWEEGILGTAASRVVEELGHPVILITKGANSKWKGSGRAPEGVDLFSLIKPTSHILEHYGGHDEACGFTIEGEDIGNFKMSIIEEFHKKYPSGIPVPALEISANFEVDRLDEEFVEGLNVLAPFGRSNPEPLFEFGPVYVTEAVSMYSGNLMRLTLKSLKDKFHALFAPARGIAAGEVIGRKVNIAATPKMNVYKGNRNLEFRIKDIKPN